MTNVSASTISNSARRNTIVVRFPFIEGAASSCNTNLPGGTAELQRAATRSYRCNWRDGAGNCTEIACWGATVFPLKIWEVMSQELWIQPPFARKAQELIFDGWPSPCIQVTCTRSRKAQSDQERHNYPFLRVSGHESGSSLLPRRFAISWQHRPAKLRELTRMSHRGEGSGRKVARSGGGARSTSGNHRTGLPRRACSPSSPRVYRFFVRARHTTPPTRRAAQIRLATPSLS